VTLTSPATQVDFTGLDLDAAKAYMVWIGHKGANVASCWIKMNYNDDTVETNYDSQHLYSVGTTITTYHADRADFVWHEQNQKSIAVGYIIRPSGGQPRAICYNNTREDTSMELWLFYHMWVTSANVTKISFRALTAGAMDTGTRITIFRMSG